MIWILLLYVLPLVANILGLYYIIKRDRGTIKDFVKQLLFLFIPGFNILIMLAGIFFAIEAWIVNNDKLQDFLNRKL